MKQPTSMWLFPHQQAEKSLQNQHVLSILQVGSHQLQYRFFRTNKPKSRHKTNTFCPLTQKSPQNHPVLSFNPLFVANNKEKTPEPGQVPGSGGGGWGIRTPEGLHPTRFPSVRHRPLGESSVHIVPDNHKRKKPPRANPGQWTRSQAWNVAEKRVLHSRRHATCPPVIGQGTQ